MRRVVITGIGIYSCIGQSVEEVCKSLYSGKSGIGTDPLRKEYGYRSSLTGILPVPVLKPFLERKLRSSLSQEGEYAFIATKDAFEDAGIDSEYLDKNEIGIIYGNDSSAQAVIEANDIIRNMKDTMMVGSGAIFKSMNSTVTMNLSTIFKIKGVNMTISAACASGSHSVGLGMMFIREGLQDMVLCGGAQETNIYSMESFDGISAFSTRMDDPAGASRPFDASRDGLVPSGGAASLILEEYEHALKRGANIYAEVVGYGFSSNGGHISQPSSMGCEKAILRAVKDAGIRVGEIDYVNAHATSTLQGDAAEAMALERLFSALRTPISSTKSMTGHECWMAGASEIIYSVIMMQNSFIAPNINFEHPDQYSANLNIAAGTIDKELDVVLSNSFGFGGTNSAIVLRKVK